MLLQFNKQRWDMVAAESLPPVTPGTTNLNPLQVFRNISKKHQALLSFPPLLWLLIADELCPKILQGAPLHQ